MNILNKEFVWFDINLHSLIFCNFLHFFPFQFQYQKVSQSSNLLKMNTKFPKQALLLKVYRGKQGIDHYDSSRMSRMLN